MKNKQTPSRKLFHVVSGIFLAVSLIAFLTIGFFASYQDLKESYTLAEETTDYLKNECRKYENYEQGNSARSMQDLLDTAIGLRAFINPEDMQNSDFLNDFIRTGHVSGVIVLDSTLSVIAEADMDHQDSYSIWKETLEKEAIQNLFQYPDKTYVDKKTVNEIPYDIAALATEKDGLLIFCYSSRKKPDTDPYEYSQQNILQNNSFYKNPVLVITDGTQILSTNDANLKEMKKEEYQKLNSSITWKEKEFTKLEYDSSTWYGVRRVYGNYYVYAAYPAEEIFSNRTNLVVFGIMIYLALGLVILSVQMYADKKNLRRMGKQMRTIQAISTTFTSLFLLHLDKDEMEPIRPSDQMREVFERDVHPEAFFDAACRELAAPGYQKTCRAFLAINSMAERLRGKRYIGMEFQDHTGKWYSLQLIPQRYDEEGNVQAVLVATDDVTAMKEAEELSFKDQLTGLYNRNYLESRSKDMVRTGDYPVTLIMADCNYLKRTNDTMGHEYGDLLLQRVAEAIRESIPDNCLAMRVGGDEFLIIGMHVSEQEAEKIIEKIREKLREKSDETLQLSVSFGTAAMTDDSVSFDTAYQQADDAMYREKQAAHAARE